MRHRFLFLTLVFSLVTSGLLAQDKNFTRHTVAKGETISQIATKYNVTPYDIYKLNPDAQKGIQENDLILVPNSTIWKSVTSAVPDKPKLMMGRTHVAKPKETLYSISRDYGVDVEELKRINAGVLGNGLKIGQTIKIPDSTPNVSSESPKENSTVVAKEPKPSETSTQPKAAVSNEKNGGKQVLHVVQPKETKFGIAKKYGITVQELEKRNPAVVSSLPVGFQLIISGTEAKTNLPKPSVEKQIVEKPKPVTTEIVKDEIVETKTIRTLTKNGYANYEVKAGETMYSLANYFKISEDELLQLNPTLKEGVKSGMILKVPATGTIKVESVTNPVQNSENKSLITNTNRKKLALLLPFNAAKIQSDSVKTVDMRLRKDAFLNMTLDFYSGALIAADSAKTLGLNVDVSIFDSEESKMSSNVENIVKEHKLDQADAVIGPFYQQYVEKTAELLSGKNVPVISPLSKEKGKSFPNLYQSMPTSDFAKKAMFNYMISKNGNIVIVSDPKRVYNKELISKNFPTAKFVSLLDNGALDVANFKSQLVKNVQNYVVIETERTGLILGTTNILLNELANYQIQLVIIEPNETLDFEEVSMKRLTILKLLYPSMTKENNTQEATVFEKKYKEVNKIFPNQYATRGFDLTFDTILRLTQNSSFSASANELKSERVESKFQYTKDADNGYANHGIYILEYQDDLTVKQVN